MTVLWENERMQRGVMKCFVRLWQSLNLVSILQRRNLSASLAPMSELNSHLSLSLLQLLKL